MLLLLAHERAERLGDVAGRQGAGRDLVQQRLEEVEVAPVDQRQADLRVDAEAARGVQPGEPAADHDDPEGQTRDLGDGGHRPRF